MTRPFVLVLLIVSVRPFSFSTTKTTTKLPTKLYFFDDCQRRNAITQPLSSSTANTIDNVQPLHTPTSLTQPTPNSSPTPPFNLLPFLSSFLSKLDVWGLSLKSKSITTRQDSKIEANTIQQKLFLQIKSHLLMTT